MTVNNALLVKIVLAVVSVIFVWFGVGELFPAADSADQLLSIGIVGFGLGAIILP